MSVINKMLKDLEDRQQPESSLESGAGQSVIIERGGSKSSPLLLILLLMILILLGVISWQMLSQGTQQVVVQPKAQAPVSVPQHQSTQSKEPIGSQLVVQTGEQDANQETEQAFNLENGQVASQHDDSTAETVPASQAAVQNPEIIQTQSEDAPVTDQQALAANTNTEQVIAAGSAETGRSASASAPQQVAKQSKEQITAQGTAAVPKPQPQPATKLVIEKSTTQMTLAQRIDKTLKEAKTSFDKGYITEAIEKLEQVLRFDDGHVEARNLLAGAWYGRGELNAAIRVLNDGLQRYPLVEDWRLTAAKIFFKENNPAGALSYLDINLNEASKEFYTMKGTLARQLRQFTTAESAYTKLTQMEPQVGNWWLGLAITQDSLGKSALAKASYQSVLAKGGVSKDSAEFAKQRIAQIEGQS